LTTFLFHSRHIGIKVTTSRYYDLIKSVQRRYQLAGFRV
jgi:hypothetical protein